MPRRLSLKTSLGVAGWFASSRYSFGNNFRSISKFSVTLPGLGRDGANNSRNRLLRRRRRPVHRDATSVVH